MEIPGVQVVVSDLNTALSRHHEGGRIFFRNADKQVPNYTDAVPKDPKLHVVHWLCKASVYVELYELALTTDVFYSLQA